MAAPRTLGRTGPTISPVVFGAMAQHGGGDDGQRLAVLEAAIDAGITTIDTAPLYDFGGSERLVGRAVAGRRHEVQILTKVGLRWDTEHGEELFSTPERTVRRDARPESIREEVERSLERLGVERIDLVQVHHPDRRTPIDETMGALADIVRAGRIGAVGVSNFEPAEVHAAAKALGDIPLVSAQDRYNLLYREVEEQLLPTCRSLGVGLLAYSPLAQGLLAGKLLRGAKLDADDGRHGDPAFRGKNLEAAHRFLAEQALPVADRLRITLPQLALAWLLAQDGVDGVVAGARTVAQVRANAEVMAIDLDDESRRRLNAAAARVRIDPSVGLGRRARMWRRLRRGAGRVRRLFGG